MSYLQVTAVRPSVRVPDQFNTLGISGLQCIAPVKIYNLHNALKLSIGSSKRCTELMKCNTSYCYQQCTTVCSFGGKEESKNGNEGGSPWKSIEKAMSSFKKEPSLEDVLRQQMERKEFYDGDPPGGSGGGGGGDGGSGFGGTDDEGFDGLLDDILQVTLAILALMVLYLYIIKRDQVKLFVRDTFDFILGKKGPRIRTIMYAFAQFYQKFRAKVPYDPYWLEKAIITTPTWWDSPEKYRRVLKLSDPSDRAIKSSKSKFYSDSDENTNSSDNAYEDSDNDNDNENDHNKAYDDDDDDDDDDNDYNAYGGDDDDDDF